MKLSNKQDHHNKSSRMHSGYLILIFEFSKVKKDKLPPNPVQGDRKRTHQGCWN